MELFTENWNIVPREQTNNKNAIFFAISDNYCFAVATLIMSLYKHCAKTAKSLDILIYHDGLSAKNMALLQSLHQNTFFISLQFPRQWQEIVEHPRTARWGNYVVCKFFGFELIKKYQTVIHLDADMLVRKDITELFRLKEEVAWRTILGWNINEIFAPLLSDGEEMHCGNGGMLVFTNKLLKYKIDEHAVLSAYWEIKDLEDGGIDELIIAWLLHKNQAEIKEVDVHIYNTPTIFIKPETKLVHFLNARKVVSKPWVSLTGYLYFRDWVTYYKKWLKLGGEGPASFSQEDYFNLFGYDKAKEIIELKKKVSSISKELEEKDAQIALLTKKKKKLTADIKKLKQTVKDLKEKIPQ